MKENDNHDVMKRSVANTLKATDVSNSDKTRTSFATQTSGQAFIYGNIGGIDFIDPDAARSQQQQRKLFRIGTTQTVPMETTGDTFQEEVFRKFLYGAGFFVFVGVPDTWSAFLATLVVMLGASLGATCAFLLAKTLLCKTVESVKTKYPTFDTIDQVVGIYGPQLYFYKDLQFHLII